MSRTSRAHLILFLAGVLSILGMGQAARAQAPDTPDEYVMTGALVIEGVSSGGRTLIQTDAVEALRVTGQWQAPVEGGEITLGDGSKKAWTKKETGDDGWLRVRGGGYAYWRVESSVERVMILEASGHGMAMVNDEPRTGDPYEFGYVKLPVLLKAGANEILLKSGRGRVRGKLVAPPADVFLNMSDVTMPDLLVDGPDAPFGAVIVVNASRDALVGAVLEAWEADKVATTTIPTVPALSIRKVLVNLIAPGVTDTGENEFRFVIVPSSSSRFRADEAATMKIGVRRSTDKHKRTFISDIDGSVQYYSVVPPPEGTDLSQAKGVILSLHGASVEATNQANCYKQRDWCYVVCPTNRRPYGFDWEDWGRTDALEVLAEARRQFNLDDRRTYLTGHSMGGHGTWNIGVQYPGTFAAIGPSAGWISFWSYAGGANRENASDIEKILLRATCSSDTLAMKQNLAQQGVYILHGDADDNVPVAQARTMREELGKFHPDFVYYEQPGAGHWWGDQCVDWDPMIEFFKRHVRAEEKNVRSIDFTTVNPPVSGGCRWVRIEEQIRPFEASRVQISVDTEKRRVVLKTENVGRLCFDAPDDSMLQRQPFTVEIDGQTLSDVTWNNSKAYQSTCFLGREGDQWKVTGSTGSKRPRLFKSAFGNHAVLVYGTRGSEEEKAVSGAKARFDAETFWYRGNGDLRVMSDEEYLKDRPRVRDGEGQSPYPDSVYASVILYGNAETNGAWATVLGPAAPVSLHRGMARVGDHEIRGEDVGCVFLAPMKDDGSAMVGVVGGTGLAGMRLTDRLPYFVSGVGVPDWAVISPDLLTKGAAGVKGAGFFGNDWTVEAGEAVWAD